MQGTSELGCADFKETQLVSNDWVLQYLSFALSYKAQEKDAVPLSDKSGCRCQEISLHKVSHACLDDKEDAGSSRPELMRTVHENHRLSG